MDERQTQVKVGEGLQESRLNRELIDFLGRYWHYPVFALAAVVGVYWVLGWLERQGEARLDKAFAAYNAAYEARDPEALLEIADRHASVAELATVSATDLLLQSSRLGVEPAAVTPGAPQPTPPELTQETIQARLTTARDVLAAQLEAIGSNPGKVMFAQRTRWNLASAEAGLGDLDAAMRTIESYREVAEAERFADQVAAADVRLELLIESKTAHALLSKVDLPADNQPPLRSSAQFRPGQGDPLGPGGEFESQAEQIMRAIREGGELPPGVRMEDEDPDQPPAFRGPAQPTGDPIYDEFLSPTRPAGDEPAAPAGDPEDPGDPGAADPEPPADPGG